ncbi:copper resistance CopC/CopD family protein [Streptomyces spiralis]|uniref:copper resistance CopC/CopD family protein n=1 Tax=Streptomyces spiralis TaxID=66376 RepID=UPI00167405AA|nr:copper resistance protein CopC [Streptomyces spiralis]
MVLGAVLLLLLLGGAGPASAHAVLRSSDPADGTVLKAAPASVTLTFSESVGLLDDSFRLFGPDGRRVHTGEARHAPGHSDTAEVAFPAGLGQGTFTVAWRVVSADSHPVSGAFTFSVGKPSPTSAAVDTGPDENPATGALWDLARYAAYGAAALLIGTAAFVLLCRPPDPGPLRRPLAAGWWTLLASTVVLLALRAPYETGAGPASALDPAALARTLTGRPGLVLLARLALLAPVAAFLVRLSRRGPSRTTPATGAALALALALTWAASEHASAGIQVPSAMASSVLHLLAMAVWLGGLTALLTTLQRATADPDPESSSGDDPRLTATVARFSRIAFLAVTVLVVTGVYQSWRGLGSWTALTDTTYGRLLLAKLAAVVLLLAAAGGSRRWTARLVTAAGRAGSAGSAGTAATGSEAVQERTPEPVGGPSYPAARTTAPQTVSTSAPLSGPPAGAAFGTSSPCPSPAPGGCLRALRRSVLAEVAVAVAVLVVSTVLSGTLPGRAAAEAAGTAPAAGIPGASVTTIPFDTGTPGGRGTVQITLEPGRVGQNAVEAVVFGPDGGLSTVPELRLSLSLPAQKIGPIDARLTDRGGYWGTDSLNLPIPGAWTAKATVRVSELDQASGSRTVRILR